MEIPKIAMSFAHIPVPQVNEIATSLITHQGLLEIVDIIYPVIGLSSAQKHRLSDHVTVVFTYELESDETRTVTLYFSPPEADLSQSDLVNDFENIDYFTTIDSPGGSDNVIFVGAGIINEKVEDEKVENDL